MNWNLRTIHIMAEFWQAINLYSQYLYRFLYLHFRLPGNYFFRDRWANSRRPVCCTAALTAIWISLNFLQDVERPLALQVEEHQRLANKATGAIMFESLRLLTACCCLLTPIIPPEPQTTNSPSAVARTI